MSTPARQPHDSIDPAQLEAALLAILTRAGRGIGSVLAADILSGDQRLATRTLVAHFRLEAHHGTQAAAPRMALRDAIKVALDRISHRPFPATLSQAVAAAERALGSDAPDALIATLLTGEPPALAAALAVTFALQAWQASCPLADLATLRRAIHHYRTPEPGLPAAEDLAEAIAAVDLALRPLPPLPGPHLVALFTGDAGPATHALTRSYALGHWHGRWPAAPRARLANRIHQLRLERAAQHSAPPRLAATVQAMIAATDPAASDEDLARVLAADDAPTTAAFTARFHLQPFFGLCHGATLTALKPQIAAVRPAA